MNATPASSNDALDATAAAVMGVLRGLRLPLHDEKRLQEAMAEALEEAAIEHTTEALLGPGERVDFLTPDGLAIECKLQARKRAIYHQLCRYARHSSVSGLLLVTNTAMGLPPAIEGKPVFYCSLGGSWL